MTPPPDSGIAGAQQRSIFSQEGGGGTLPSWAAYGAFVGSLVFCAAVLAALGMARLRRQSHDGNSDRPAPVPDKAPAYSPGAGS